MANDNSPRQPLRVLIVEDDQAQLRTLSAIVAGEGFDVLECRTGACALDNLRVAAADVVILDLRLPDIGEAELLDALAAFAEHVPIILNTAYVSIESARRAVNVGVFAYVEKGRDPGEIVRQVHRAVEVRLKLRAEALEKAIVERTRDLQVAGDKLRESEERYRALFDSSNDAVFVHPVMPDGSPGRFTAVNDAACERLGYRREELLRMSPADIDAVDMAEQRARAIQCLGARPRVTFEMVHCARDGRRIPVEISLNTFDLRGQRTAISTARDLTERKRAEEKLRASEERYRTVVEDQTDLICRLAADGTITFVNAVFCRFFGKPAAELLGRRWQPLALPEDLPGIEERLRSLSSVNPVVVIENRVYSGTGQIHWMQFVNRGLFDADGRITEIQTVGRDITEMKQLANQLLRSQRLEAVGQLAAGVAHEFNNILMGIMGFAYHLRDHFEPDTEAQRHLQRIEDLTKQAAAVAGSLLTYSRQQPREAYDLQLDEFLERPCATWAKLVGEDIRFVFKPNSGDALVHADPGQLEQALLNLVLNARDAMPQGGDLTIETRRAAPDGPVIITVRDTGVGMDAETRKRAFDPFFTTKPPGKGTGLGLSVVYGIAMAHGGTVAIESAPGKGTAVTISLPLAGGKG